MGHETIIKLYCRVCFSTNKLKKIGDVDKYFFCVGEPKARICKLCHQKADQLMNEGSLFSENMDKFGIKRKFKNFNSIGPQNFLLRNAF